MERKKVLILGIDGLDPRLTKKYIDEGRMPNTKKFLERGSAEIRYEMIGGQPTVTPPMWTTLATGASPRVHGITGYYRHNVERDILEYNFESTNCHAEQLWNVTAEAGIKTLVWHGPAPLGRQAAKAKIYTLSTVHSREVSMSAQRRSRAIC